MVRWAPSFEATQRSPHVHALMPGKGWIGRRVLPMLAGFERGASRADDRFSEAAMEDRKREGYF